MMPEIYLDYAIRLLEAAKKKTKARRKKRAKFFEQGTFGEVKKEAKGIWKWFKGLINMKRIELKDIFGTEDVDKIIDEYMSKVAKITGDHSTKELKELLKSYKDRLAAVQGEDAEYKKYLILKTLEEPINKLKEYAKKCEKEGGFKDVVGKMGDQEVKLEEGHPCRAVVKLMKDPAYEEIFKPFSLRKRLWFWFRSLHPVMKVLVILVAIVAIYLILKFVFKSIGFALKIIAGLLTGNVGAVNKARNALENADVHSIAKATAAVSKATRTVAASYY